jgi:hypothetical protein
MTLTTRLGLRAEDMTKGVEEGSAKLVAALSARPKLYGAARAAVRPGIRSSLRGLLMMAEAAKSRPGVTQEQLDRISLAVIAARDAAAEWGVTKVRA